MKLQEFIKKSGIALFLAASFFLIQSCEKTGVKPVFEEGAANVIINLGIDLTNEKLMPALGGKEARMGTGHASVKSNKKQARDVEDIQTQIIPFGENQSIVATLAPAQLSGETATENELELLASNDAPLSSGSTPVAAAIQEEIDTDVRYRIIVYNNDGSVNSNLVYNYGGTLPQFKLDAEATYTFVIYSMNSTTVDPIDVTGTTLSTAQVNAVTGDLMYFKKTITVRAGDNYLDAVLKHQFSQITTTIVLDGTVAGNIMSIGDTKISPTRASASINLSTGVLGYSTANVSTPVLFPSPGAGVLTLTSTPTLLISPLVTDGQISINNLTVGDLTKNLVIRDLKINPGHKYNLNLKLKSPCIEEVGEVKNQWHFGQGTSPSHADVTRNLTLPGTDYGFVFNIIQLDNSFNLTINGTQLITRADGGHEIQFESPEPGVTFPASTPANNIEFVSGGKWGRRTSGKGQFDYGAPYIWDMDGFVGRQPIIRVIVSNTGDVSMYGKKSQNGPLEPLKLTGGSVFNTITWNTNSSNRVIISQMRLRNTGIQFTGAGRNIIPCP